MGDNTRRDILAVTEAANLAFVNGDAGPYHQLFAHSPDLSVLGPFGGPPGVGWDVMKNITGGIARQFASGTSRVEPLLSYESGDLFVSVHIEHQDVVFAGQEKQQRWSLRVTQVYRREDGAWRVVHRHADPMTTRRSLPQAAEIARG